MRCPFPHLFAALLCVSCQIACSDENGESLNELEDQVAILVNRLGHEQYELREQAHQELLDLGEDILPVLENISQPADLEVRWRIRSVIKTFRRDPLVGTQWYIEYTSKVSVKNKTIEFLENGTFRYVGSAQSTPENETWDPETEDGVIRFYFNNKYSTYEGRRTDNRTMVGKSQNIKGKSWTWRATLVNPPKN
jgi:hypothetical protein